MVARSLLRSARLLRSPAVAAARPARPMAGQAVRFASGLEITEEDEIKIPAKDFLMSTKPLWEIKPGADKEGRTEHVRSSDMPWILCSTLVFGPWVCSAGFFFASNHRFLAFGPSIKLTDARSLTCCTLGTATMHTSLTRPLPTLKAPASPEVNTASRATTMSS